MNFTPISSTPCVIGEGPVWHPTENLLYFIDIPAGKIYQLDPVTNTEKLFQCHSMVGCIVPKAGGGVYAALEDGIYFVDVNAGTSLLIKSHELKENQRFNDGKCSPNGSLWAGVMDKTGADNGGYFARFSKDSHHVVLENTTISNGLAWSVCGTKLYYIDTPTNVIRCFQYDSATDTVGECINAFSFVTDQGYPDGMTIDADGKLWIAHFAGGKVSRWDPDNGLLMESYSVDANNITSITFGGPNLTQIFVTTATDGLPPELLSDNPSQGKVFTATSDVAGLPANMISW